MLSGNVVSGRNDPAGSMTNGFPGVQRSLDNGELRRVQGIEDITDEALNSAPGKNQISLEEAGY